MPAQKMDAGPSTLMTRLELSSASLSNSVLQGLGTAAAAPHHRTPRKIHCAWEQTPAQGTSGTQQAPGWRWSQGQAWLQRD